MFDKKDASDSAKVKDSWFSRGRTKGFLLTTKKLLWQIWPRVRSTKILKITEKNRGNEK